LTKVVVKLGDYIPCPVWFHSKLLRHGGASILDGSILGFTNVQDH